MAGASESPSTERRAAGLVLSAAILSAAHAVHAVGFTSLTDLFLAVLVDATFWAWLLVVAAALEGRLRRKWVAALAFYPLFHVSLIAGFVHTFFFASAAERRLSLLDVDPRTLVFFFARVLPSRGVVELAGYLAAVHVGAWLVVRRGFVPSLRAVRAAALASTFGVAVVGLLAPRIPSPLYDTLHQLYESARLPRVRTDGVAPAYPVSSLDRSAEARSTGPVSPFKKILVFVMETMTAHKFEEERKRLGPATFFSAERSHFHSFERYFPNNQDSRTGMLDMLSSRLVPYEAYTEYGRDHYSFLSRKGSLVDRMNGLGYETVFAVSQVDVEIVVGDLPWKRTLSLSEEDVRRDSARFLCFVPFEFEHGCEDRALLPRVLEAIDSSERVFLYQEFIWGHDPEYNRASGKTDTEYYSAYLDAIRAHLAEKQLMDETLVVVTSDHGFRDKELQRELFVYRIPLLYFAQRFQQATDERLFSHVDFARLLEAQMVGGAEALAADPFVMMVGPTGTGLLAVYTSEEDFLLMSSRNDARYLLRAENLRRGAPASVDPAGFAALFDQYRQSFDASAH